MFAKVSFDKFSNENLFFFIFISDTFSVIMCACGTNDLSVNEESLVKIVELLIEKGVDVNSNDKWVQNLFELDFCIINMRLKIIY